MSIVSMFARELAASNLASSINTSQHKRQSYKTHPNNNSDFISKQTNKEKFPAPSLLSEVVSKSLYSALTGRFFLVISG